MLPEVLAWLDRCKAALRLGEYEITFSLVPEMADLGAAFVDPVYQRADIVIRDPSDGSHPDWKKSLLHEAVHVRNGGALGTAPGSEERAALERGVEMMTRIIYPWIEAGTYRTRIDGIARLCARTVETARMGVHRSDMNGARIAEIALALGGMDLPEEAKALVTELIGLAAGGGDDAGIDPPMKEDPKPDPMMAMAPDEEKAFRKAVGDKTVDALRLNAAKILTAQTITLARTALGPLLTPADEKEIEGMTHAEGAAYLKGLRRASRKASGAPGHRPAAEPPIPDKEADPSTFLRVGEDPKKVPIELLEVRRALARSAAGAGRAG